MKKLLIAIMLIFVLMGGIYLWLMSQGGAENADQTPVIVNLPLDTGS